MKLTSVLPLLLTVSFAAPVPEHYVLHEKRAAVHARWVKRDRVPEARPMLMRVGLTQTNLDSVYNQVMKVSDPNSPTYGKYWTQQEVADAFKPSAETHDTVRKWLTDGGIPDERIVVSQNQGWLIFPATAADVERLMVAEFYDYHDTVTGDIVAACDQYHVPKHASQHIDYITPGIKLLANPKFERPRSSSSISTRPERPQKDKRGLPSSIHPLLEAIPDPPPYNASDLSHCDQYITPNCLQALYNFTEPPAGRTPNPNNTFGVYESLLQFWNQPDLDAFFTNYTGGKIPNGTHPIAANIDGGVQTINDENYDGDEVELDLQVAYPIVYPQKIVDYDVDDLFYQTTEQILSNTSAGFLNTFLDAIDGSYCNFTAYNETGDAPYDPVYPNPVGYDAPEQCGTYVPANVISVSYGAQEADLPTAYQRRQCLEFGKLGMQGISFIFASGDYGVAGPPGDDNDNGCLGPNADIYSPGFPVTCPYITAVGATEVFPGFTVFQNESAVFRGPVPQDPYNFTSGGGFSNIYPIPDYQKEAVATYFSEYNPPVKYYSTLAPDTEDINLLPNATQLAGKAGGVYNRLGRGYPDVAANGRWAAVYSGGALHRISGTSMSSPIFAALINRVVEERLNAGKGPLGFLNPALYSNPSMFKDIVNGTNAGCGGGFEVTPGWDPVTGLGTPDYPKLLEYFMSLP